MYDLYRGYVKSVIETQDLSTFKQDEKYRYVLEHVTKDYGEQYLALLADTPITVDRIRAFCRANDAIGSPRLEDYAVLGCAVSPTSLRYLYHAHLLLSHFKSFANQFSIVEIGGGYGGLCAAIGWLASLYNVRITSYSIVDLPEATQLQNLYLVDWSLPFSVNYFHSDTYGAGVPVPSEHPLYLISNYCFSEIDAAHQERYRQILFPKVSHGFLTWNFCPVYALGFPNQVVEPENPCTGNQNAYVRF